MKQIIPFFLLFFAFGESPGQIVLENIYPKAGFHYEHGEFYLSRFGHAGSKYVNKDEASKSFILYNLDHTPYHTFQFHVPAINDQLSTFFLSDLLFDLDTGLEYLAMYDSLGVTKLEIRNEDGSILLRTENMAPRPFLDPLNGKFPIVNTEVGAKLIMQNKLDSSVHVYGLPGFLITKATEPEHGQTNPPISPDFKVFPNPSQGEVTAEFDRDQGFTKATLYNPSLTIVGQYSIMVGTTRIKIKTAGLATGIYYLQLGSAHGKTKLKKILIDQ